MAHEEENANKGAPHWRSFLFFLLIPFAMALYLVLALRFGFNQRIPWVSFLVLAIGLSLLTVEIRMRFSWIRLLLNGFAWMLAIFFGWWTLSFSAYQTGEPVVASGETLPEQALALQLASVSEGQVELRNLFSQKQATLLIFFRGYW